MAIDVSSESIYEFYFAPSEEREETEHNDIYSEFITALPDEIKNHLPEDILSSDTMDAASGAEHLTDFSYLWKEIITGIRKMLLPSISEIAFIFVLLLLSALLKSLKNIAEESGTGRICNTVISVGIILSVVGTELLMLDTVEQFKDFICNIMNGITPAFAVIYTASGNINTATIQSGGIMLLVTLCQNLFSLILMPSVRICLMFAVVDSIFPEIRVGPISTAFKNIATGIMIISVTLFSFVLSLQNSIAQTADSFGARSLKFAIGNLIPIIGGAVSDSLGTISGSLSLLKSAGGTAAIMAVILMIVPCIVRLILRRFSLFICKTVAGVMKCTEEEKLLSELGSITSLMLAFCAAISIAFIYMLTMFTQSTLAAIS